MTGNEDLIAEARKWAAGPFLGFSTTRELDRGVLYVRKLVVALESATARLREAEKRLDDALNASFYHEGRWREAEARAENGPCWDEGFTVPVPRGECAPLPPLCTLKAGHLGAHQAGGATWTRRAAGGIERKLREAEAVIAEALEPKNIDYGHIDIALERVRAILSRYKPTNQEGT